MAVALFSSRTVDPGLPKAYEGLGASGWLRVIYLDELRFPENASLEEHILEFIIVSEQEAKEQIKRLKAEIAGIPDFSDQRQIIELIQKILVYKFNTLSREEIERMFTMDDLKQTRYMQELAAELQEQGREEGERMLVMRLLTHRIGSLNSDSQAQVQSLSLEKIEALSLDLLDFQTEADLRHWLATHS